MEEMMDKLTTLVEKGIKELLTELDSPRVSEEDIPKVIFERPKSSVHGDWSTNVSFLLARSFPILQLSPDKWAEQLTFHLRNMIDSETMIAEVSWVKPGFINFTLDDLFLIDQSIKNVDQFYDGKIGFLQQKPYLVEFSSPNIAKPFTIGHLRSTIIGDAIAKLLMAAGAQVYKDNHLGDWGTQFGKQICAIKKWGSVEEISKAKEPIKELVALYIRFHEEAEAQPELNDEARAWFKKLEDGDQEARELWKFCVQFSMEEFDRIYQLLRVEFTENNGQGFGESFFEDKMTAVVAELKEKRILTESEGAEVIFYENDKFPPLLILKKDGSTLYATRDLAADKFRWQTHGSDLTIINEVGMEQTLYFKQLFAAERMLGWYDDDSQRIHVGHGLYRFKDRKMSTRKGDVVWLNDVLEAAFERARSMTRQGLGEDQIWKIAIGAIKWNDLSREAGRDVNFDLDEILNLKGNSGPYMQYTVVRALSVLAKSLNQDFPGQVSQEELLIQAGEYLKQMVINRENFSAEEKNLIRWIARYEENLQKAATSYSPHIWANYLYELAGSFNSFYAAQPIVGHSRAEWLTLLTALAIKNGLTWLGIETVEKM